MRNFIKITADIVVNTHNIAYIKYDTSRMDIYFVGRNFISLSGKEMLNVHKIFIDAGLMREGVKND